MARRKRTKKTRVVITGISGRLGQVLTRRLHRMDNMEVIGIDRRRFPQRPKDVEHLRIDIRRKACEDLFRRRRVDVIFHLGLMHDPRRGSDEHHSWNILGTQRIFDYAQRHGVPKVVLLSSADVYGPQDDNPAFLSESAPLLGALGFPQIRDLISVDMLAQSYFWRAPEIETVVLRPVHILGQVDNALSNYLRLKRPPVLFGFDPMMQVIHEEDVITAVMAAAKPGIRGIFNVAGPYGLPLRQLVELAGAEALELPHPVAPILVRQAHLLRLVDAPAAELEYLRYAVTVDDRRARELLRFTPQYSVSQAVDAALGRVVTDPAGQAAVQSPG
ncbi:MAG TPA: NAD-dependent epimerase [Myxococcales bacterium]|nr:NAD-dependent epimerase [Myxococcales bacterium]HAN32292.1 NAD-dependent epimerase [Myxococcales bacterium]